MLVDVVCAPADCGKKNFINSSSSSCCMIYTH